MTLRKVTARPVDTYIRPSTVGASFEAQARQNRTNQVSSVLNQLGVVLQNKRTAQLKEDTAEINAAANNKARVLAAEYMPTIDAAMQRPETYEQTVEEFMRSDTFQGAYKGIESAIAQKSGALLFGIKSQMEGARCFG